MKRLVRPAASMVIAVACLVSGCGSAAKSGPVTSPLVVRHFLGIPATASRSKCTLDPLTVKQRPCTTWADTRSIYVTTWGSSSCPLIPTSLSVAGRGLVVIETHVLATAGSVCKADLAATTSVVRLPKTIDLTTPLTVRIDGITRRLPSRRV